jgi:predicted dehydrogenase
MNIIIVGAGGHARNWKAYIDLHPDWKLVGIVDTDAMKLENASSWGIPEEWAYPYIKDAVKWSEEPIDAALITSPIPTHHLLATEAMELGLHVIVEKNMASTIDLAKSLVQLARKHPNLCTSMGTQYRFRPNWWTLHEMFTKNACPIGPISHFTARVTSKQGVQRSGWRAWLAHIFAEDMMVHHIDCLRYCLGMELVKIQAQVYKPAWSEWLGTSTIMANLVLAPNGKERDKSSYIYGQYYGDWQARGLKRSWEDGFEFYGPKGSIRIELPGEPAENVWEKTSVMPLVGEPAGSKIIQYLDSPDLNKVTISEIPKRYDIEHHPFNYNDQMYILDDLARCIKTGGKQQPKLNFEEGFKSFVVSQAAIMSAELEKTIWIPQYWMDPIPPL